MKVAQFSKIGDPSDVLTVVDVEKPVPKKGEVLIKVAAASVNPVDWKLIQGALPGVKPGCVGFDVSGTVESIGPDTTTNLQVGDVVYADTYPIPGTCWAEYCRVPATSAARLS